MKNFIQYTPEGLDARYNRMGCFNGIKFFVDYKNRISVDENHPKFDSVYKTVDEWQTLLNVWLRSTDQEETA